MSKRFFKPYAGAALAAILLLTASAASAAPGDKRFTWTTKSDEAKTHAVQVVRAIENFQFGPPVLELAKKTIEADPNFAFGHYLVWTFSPSPAEGRPHQEKALELAKSASDGERRYIEAVALVRSQKANEALPILSDLAAKYPDERMVQMMLGQVKMNAGNLGEARKHFQRAIELDGTTPRAHAMLGNIALLEGDYKRARDVYQKSLAMKPEKSVPFFPYAGIAFSYVYEGQYEPAIKSMEKFRDDYVASGANANFPEVFIWNSIARMYLESERPEKALEAYKMGYAAVEKSSLPDDQKAVWRGRLLHGNARALARLGKHDEAWKQADSIKTMIEQGGEEAKQYWPAYHYMAGYLMYEKGDYAKAIEHMAQADLTDPFHLLILARSYEKAGDQANAQKHYKMILDSSQFGIERAIAYPEAKKKIKS